MILVVLTSVRKRREEGAGWFEAKRRGHKRESLEKAVRRLHRAEQAFILALVDHAVENFPIVSAAMNRSHNHGAAIITVGNVVSIHKFICLWSCLFAAFPPKSFKNPYLNLVRRRESISFV